MIDPQTVDHSTVKPMEHQRMRILKHTLVLHPQADQCVDVEKTTIVDVLRSNTPVGQAIVLALQQLVESIGGLVDLRQHAIDRLRPFGMLLQFLMQHPPEDFLVAMTSSNTAAIDSLGGGQMSCDIGGECQEI